MVKLFGMVFRIIWLVNTIGKAIILWIYIFWDFPFYEQNTFYFDFHENYPIIFAIIPNIILS